MTKKIDLSPNAYRICKRNYCRKGEEPEDIMKRNKERADTGKLLDRYHARNELKAALKAGYTIPESKRSIDWGKVIYTTFFFLTAVTVMVWGIISTRSYLWLLLAPLFSIINLIVLEVHQRYQKRSAKH